MKSRVFVALAVGVSCLSQLVAPASAQVPQLGDRGVFTIVEGEYTLDTIPQGFEPMVIPEDVRVVHETTEGHRITPDLLPKLWCHPNSRIHNIHPSSRQDDLPGPKSASVHGDWQKNDCKNDKAKLTMKLQALYGDRNAQKGWFVTVATAQNDAYHRDPDSNNSPYKEVVARAGCRPSRLVQWRAKMDVDVIGERDRWGYMQRQDKFKCEPVR